jgi:hypothetical protein
MTDNHRGLSSSRKTGEEPGYPTFYADLGGCRPGDESHSLICEAVSACRARLSNRSRSIPGLASSAACRKRSASAARRSSNVAACFIRRRRSDIAYLLLGNDRSSRGTNVLASLIFRSTNGTIREPLKPLNRPPLQVGSSFELFPRANSVALGTRSAIGSRSAHSAWSPLSFDARPVGLRITLAAGVLFCNIDATEKLEERL